MTCQIDCGICKTTTTTAQPQTATITGKEQKISIETTKKAFVEEGVSQELIDQATQYSKDFSFDRNISTKENKTTISIGIVNDSNQSLVDVVVAEIVPKKIAQKASSIKSNVKMVVLKDDPIIQFVIPRIDANQKLIIEYSVDGTITASIQEFAQPLIVAWRQFVQASCETGCDDGNPCTIDKCVEGACISFPVQDGGSCGYAKTCSAGVCVLKQFSKAPEAATMDVYSFVAIGAVVLAFILIIVMRAKTQNLKKRAEKEK